MNEHGFGEWVESKKWWGRLTLVEGQQIMRTHERKGEWTPVQRVCSHWRGCVMLT